MAINIGTLEHMKLGTIVDLLFHTHSLLSLYTFINAIIERNGCNPDPCLNGECNNAGPGEYECICFPGFTGQHCEDGMVLIISYINLRTECELVIL